MSDDYNLVPSDDFGELVPLSPSIPLSPTSDAGWVVPNNDFDSTEHYSQGNEVKMFGQAIPNITQQQATQFVGEITNMFSADTVWQPADRNFVNAVSAWYTQNAFAPVPNEPSRHSYRLNGYRFPPGDVPYVTNFLNYCETIGATERQVKIALTWYAKLAERIGQQNKSQSRSNEMSDAQWNNFVAKNERDVENGKAYLQQLWGYAYRQNIGLVAEFFNSLPASEREKFENMVLENGVMAMSDPMTIMWLYDQAIGGPLPSGAALAREIAEIEEFMRTNRKEYVRSERIQHRYRELIRRRDG